MRNDAEHRFVGSVVADEDRIAARQTARAFISSQTALALLMPVGLISTTNLPGKISTSPGGCSAQTLSTAARTASPFSGASRSAAPANSLCPRQGCRGRARQCRRVAVSTRRRAALPACTGSVFGARAVPRHGRRWRQAPAARKSGRCHEADGRRPAPGRRRSRRRAAPASAAARSAPRPAAARARDRESCRRCRARSRIGANPARATFPRAPCRDRRFPNPSAQSPSARSPSSVRFRYLFFSRRMQAACATVSSDLRSAATPQTASTAAAPIIKAGADEIAGGDAAPRAGSDQHAEQDRSGNAAGGGADGVKKRDRQRADLQRENLAHRQIGGARRRRSEEEHGHPGHRQRICAVKRSRLNRSAVTASRMPDGA